MIDYDKRKEISNTHYSKHLLVRLKGALSRHHFLSLISLVLLLTNVYLAKAQTTTPPFGKWIHTNVGIPLYNEELRDGFRYQAYMFAPQIDVFKIKNWQSAQLGASVEPQMVFVTGLPEDELECGVNLNFYFRKMLSPRLMFRASIGSGPHYITARTEHQSRGYIFSDNFELAGQFLNKKKTQSLFLGIRFRHISNANLARPNAGIDHFFGMIGYGWRID